MAQDEVNKTITNDPDKVWINVERTVNLGNYENIKITLGESRTVGPDDDPIELRDKIVNQCLDESDQLADEYNKISTKKLD